MKTFQRSLALGALIIATGMAAAGSGSLSEFIPKVLPVLVQVDSHGKVTSASPATELPPKLRRLLRANLDEMITAPAIDKKGHPTSSQFVMNLALHASPRPDGDYDVKFAYVSTAPVPPGSWYWVHTDGRQLALASQNSRSRREYIPDRHDQPDSWRGYERPSMPNISNMDRPAHTASSTPAPAAVPDPGRGH
ncbi:hypothetical protein [Thermomonas sp.]|uniref:hypothetical protein n=1 Tax=Thermomonas sp. TaxID=1971895 RepID=UPI00248812B7|nr:hypothetical protein [Thermomonas sp.]MDI1253052.1 hypothetical protein [Thermomonas sp.]